MLTNVIKNISLNWRSGLSIAVVSVPLSISFAIASGGTPIMGLITSAWAGLVGALIGGSNFNVISPAGAFAGILTVVALTFGVGAIPVVTIMAGVLIYLGYLINIQKFLRFVPGGAVFGFTLGIAAIIAGTQINSALGLHDLAAHDSILMNIAESFRNISSLDVTATVIFAVFLILLLLLSRVFKKIPSIIMVTPLGILLGWLVTKGHIGLHFLTLEGQYGELGAQLLQIPGLYFDWGLVVPAITIALVGILETMLSAKVADSMTETRHDERKEMRGLAIANVVSGFVGGMPATGVLGPTVLNIKMGAVSRISAVLKAVFVALITLLFFGLFKFIPMPVIAAILFYVAITMVQAKKFLLYYNHDRYSLLIAVVVASLTLYRDPASGIVVGSFIGLLIFAEKVSRGSFRAVHNSRSSDKKISLADEKKFISNHDYDILVYSVRGVLSHLSAEAHVQRLGDLDVSISSVIVRLREVAFVDIEGVEALDVIISMLKKKEVGVFLSGIDGELEKMLQAHSKYYNQFKDSGKTYTKTRFALEHLGVPLRED
ncbi:MAG: SulP family sulfate permease [Planctomycetota bacterium]|jgi:SulP family sulfate permease